MKLSIKCPSCGKVTKVSGDSIHFRGFESDTFTTRCSSCDQRYAYEIKTNPTITVFKLTQVDEEGR